MKQSKVVHVFKSSSKSDQIDSTIADLLYLLLQVFYW